MLEQCRIITHAAVERERGRPLQYNISLTPAFLPVIILWTGKVLVFKMI